MQQKNLKYSPSPLKVVHILCVLVTIKGVFVVKSMAIKCLH